MKKMLFWGALLFAGIILTGCGGGSSDDTTTQGGDGAVTSGFTTDILNGAPTFYVSYAGDPDGTTDQGTTQEEIAFTGSDGTYQVTVTQEYFDASNVSQGSTTLTVNVTLNQDGTLTALITGDPSPTTFTLDNSTADYLLVFGGDGTDTWSDRWYFVKPAGWLNGSTTVAGFTADMLNGDPTFYVSYAGDPDGTTDQGTTQEEIAFTGSDGTYQVTVTQEYFDASNVSQGSTTLTVNVTLNQDGTLTASVTGEPSSTTYTLENSTADYFLVSGVNGADTWSDYWYVAKPAGWLNGSAVVDGFTADMLNGDPTFYLSYAGDSDGTTDQGTTQEEIAFTGSDGTYQFTVTSEYFDASNVSQGSTTSTGNVTLNQDGTLTVTETGDPQPQTITLDNSTADYLLVTGVSGTDTWTDHWYFAKPADWLTGSGEPLAFSAADFNDSVVYEIWEESGGPLGAGGWAGTTIQFNSNGTATGAAGIVDPFVAEFTGATWGIDAGGRLHISAGSENYFTLTARTADYFAVCWGETAAEADGCTYPEYLFTDSAAANAFVATAP